MSKHVTFFVICIQNNHKFALDVERRNDITLSMMTDDIRLQPEMGFVIYRERTFIKCPYCDSLCRLVPDSAIITTQLKYTPEKK